MTHSYRSKLPPGVLITSVNCAICRRFVKTGDYTIAPANSVYAGKPICAECIDMARASRENDAGVGPSETKRHVPFEFFDGDEDAVYDDLSRPQSAGAESDGTGWHDS